MQSILLGFNNLHMLIRYGHSLGGSMELRYLKMLLIFIFLPVAEALVIEVNIEDAIKKADLIIVGKVDSIWHEEYPHKMFKNETIDSAYNTLNLFQKFFRRKAFNDIREVCMLNGYARILVNKTIKGDSTIDTTYIQYNFPRDLVSSDYENDYRYKCYLEVRSTGYYPDWRDKSGVFFLEKIDKKNIYHTLKFLNEYDSLAIQYID
ncbi:hypothetical protein CHISP_3701 [Chitinispirillum alkaliphilum]|nr:hypothetical protein CHISP_3701 [Chitinispirillum alkaliphilum]